MSVNKTLKDAVREIKFRSGLTQAEIADRLGVRSTYLSDMINGRVPLTESVAGKIYELFGISVTADFLYNLGEPEAGLNVLSDFKASPYLRVSSAPEASPVSQVPPGPDAAAVRHADVFLVPLVSKYAYAGYMVGYGDDEYVGTLPAVPFLIPEGQTHRGEYVAFEVKGDSMDDGTDASLKDGDLVLCRKVKRELWTGGCKLHYKKYNFVIAHTEGLLIKRIVDHDVEAGTITVHSLNPEYPDRVLDLNEVIEIRNVVQFQRKPVL